MNIWALRMDCSENTKFESNIIYSEHGCCGNGTREDKVKNIIEEMSKKTIKYNEAKSKLYSLKELMKEPESKDKECITTILKWAYAMEEGDIVFITTKEGIFISEIIGEFESLKKEYKFEKGNEYRLVPMRKIKLLKNECIFIEEDLEKIKHRFYGRRTLEKIIKTEHLQILKNYILSI